MDPKLQELLNICRSLIADGVIVDDEVHYLNRWLRTNFEIASRFPAQQIAARLKRIYADGVITDDERVELLSLLRKATRQQDPAPPSFAEPTALSLDDPPPDVEFLNRHFCFTGKFVSGSIRWCRHQIEQRGGESQDSPNPATDFLVLGAMGEPDRAVVAKTAELRAKLKVISEEHWLQFLK